MKKKTMATIVLALLATTSLVGVSAEATAPYDEFVSQVAQASELLDRAAYLSMLGFSGYGGEEEQLSLAQGLVNLFEGSSGANYWALDTGSTGSELGILGLYDSLSESNLAEWGSFPPQLREAVLLDALQTSGQFVDTAYSHSLHALSDVKDEVVFGELREIGPGGILTFEGATRMIVGHGETFRTIYASIVAARGGVDDPFLSPGIMQIAEMVPSREIWLAPSDNIQDAIDAIPDGGTIHLEAGIYRQRIEIYKNLTLVGASSQDIPTGETMIEGVEWQGAIAIMDDRGTSVVIEGLTIRGSSSAIVIGASYGLGSGTVSVDLRNVRFEDNDTALSVVGDAQVFVTQCLFEGNSISIWAREESLVTGQRCVFEKGEDSLAAIAVQNDAKLSLEECTLSSDGARGILLTPTASLNLVNCTLQGSFYHAIVVAGTTTAPPTDFAEIPCGIAWGEESLGTAPGEITGYGNTIHGAVCPESFGFLTEPEPIP